MLVSEEKRGVLFDELGEVLHRFSKDLWGYRIFGDDEPELLLIGHAKMSTEVRSDVISYLSNFKAVYFLAGLSRKDYEMESFFISRLLEHGGTLTGWKWCSSDGEWNESPEEVGCYIVYSDE